MLNTTQQRTLAPDNGSVRRHNLSVLDDALRDFRERVLYELDSNPSIFGKMGLEISIQNSTIEVVGEPQNLTKKVKPTI